MQGYFERRHTEAREDKLARKDTSNRGLNLHRHTEMKYHNGALKVSKEGMRQFTSEREEKFHLNLNSKKIRKERKSYDEIKKIRESNPEFATGKKYKKSKGSFGKLNMKHKGKK